MAADKKELLKKLNSSEEKSAKLEKQLNTIQMLHGKCFEQHLLCLYCFCYHNNVLNFVFFVA